MTSRFTTLVSLIEREEWNLAAHSVHASGADQLTPSECSELFVKAIAESPFGDDAIADYQERLEPVLKLLSELLSRGADPNYQATDRDLPPVQEATFRASLPLVEFLLRNGADPRIPLDTRPDLKNYTGFDGTALHVAASTGHIQIAECLLHHGCPVDSTGIVGQTPLHVAAKEGRAAFIQMLLNQHADINRQCTSRLRDEFLHGETALHVAVSFLQPDAATTLVHRGASKEIRCHRGLTALDVLQQHLFRGHILDATIAEDSARRLRSLFG